jgi:diaminopimelate decarboxylase
MPAYSKIKTLESIAGGSPFYIVDRQRFERNFDDLTTAFQSCYQPFILAYSYKTNYLPYLCGIIKQKGGWAEVVSRMEYDLALKVGQDRQKIIFNGPVKTADDIRLALDNGSVVNLDCRPELDAVQRYAQEHPEKPVRIGLRINIGLSDEAGRSHIQNALKIGRFGFDPATLHSELHGNKINVVSLHGHTSTIDRSPWCYEVIAKTLCRIARETFPETIDTLNIGGGFFGRMHPDMPFQNVPSFADYAEAVCGVLNADPWACRKKPTLVIEPGVAMAADCVSFIARVVSVKEIGGQVFVTVDGSAFHCKPTFHSLNMPHQIITRDEHSPLKTYSVVGSTCMEKDILLKDITAPLPCPGDYIKIDNVGAYTLVMSPPFIHPAPAIVADEDGGVYTLVRRKQTLEEVFGSYIF